MVRRIDDRQQLGEIATGAGQALRVRWPGQPPQTADIPDTLQTYLDSLRTQG